MSLHFGAHVVPAGNSHLRGLLRHRRHRGPWLKTALSIAGVFLANVAGALTAQAAIARLLYSMALLGRLRRRRAGG